MDKISKTFRQWLAGFFDAEGCVGAYKQRSGCFQIPVTISQKNPTVLYHIQRIVNVGYIKDCIKETNHVFRITSKENQIAFIKLVLPFSLVKRKQLELALQLLDLIGVSRKSIPKENKRKRIALAKEIKALKYKDYIPCSNNKVSPAYICGFWEGDGSVSCGDGKYYYRPHIRIGQKFPNIFYLIQKHLVFGRICKYRQHLYYFQITKKTDLQKFIYLVRPYALIKKKHLHIALQLTNLTNDNSSNKLLTAENLHQRKALACHLKKLNSP